jgi:hypothetical protein
MTKLVETYKGHDIKECSWGYCVGLKHRDTLAGAKKYIDYLEAK